MLPPREVGEADHTVWRWRARSGGTNHSPPSRHRLLTWASTTPGTRSSRPSKALSIDSTLISSRSKRGLTFRRRPENTHLGGPAPNTTPSVDPACGEGAFVLPIVGRLIESADEHGRPIADAVNAIRAFDLQRSHVETTRLLIVSRLQEVGVAEPEAIALARKWVTPSDFLLAAHNPRSADFVVGNPPYIRPEEVPPDRMNAYRQTCQTVSGRADIYIGFYEHGLHLLKEGGSLGFICADRWMRNAYGRKLRNLISQGFSVEAAIEMHDVDAFAEKVSAYPAITVIRRSDESSPLVATTTSGFGEAEAKKLVRWWRTNREPGNAKRSMRFCPFPT